MDILSDTDCEIPYKGGNTGVAPLSMFAFGLTIVIWETTAVPAGCEIGWATGQFLCLILGLPNMVVIVHLLFLAQIGLCR